MTAIEQYILSGCRAKDLAIKQILNATTDSFTAVVYYNTRSAEASIDNEYTLYVQLLGEKLNMCSLERQWIVISRILPHPNIQRYYTHFISTVPQHWKGNFSTSGNSHIRLRAHYLLLQHEELTLKRWLRDERIKPLEIIIRILIKITQAAAHLMSHQVN